MDCLNLPRKVRQSYVDAVEVGKPVGILHVNKAAYDKLPLFVRRHFDEALRNIMRRCGAQEGDEEEQLIDDSSAFYLLLTPLPRELVEMYPDAFYVNYLEVEPTIIGLVTGYPIQQHLILDEQRQPIPGVRMRFTMRFTDGEWQGKWMAQQFYAIGPKGGRVKKWSCSAVFLAPIGHLIAPAFHVKDGLSVRLSGTLEFRSLSDVAKHRGRKFIIREARLGRVVVVVTGGEAACLGLHKRRWGIAGEARPEFHELYLTMKLTTREEAAQSYSSFLDAHLQKFLMSELHVAEQDLAGRFRSVAQVRAFMQLGQVGDKTAGEAFVTFLNNTYATRRSESSNPGSIREHSNKNILMLGLEEHGLIAADHANHSAGGYDIPRGLSDEYHDALSYHVHSLYANYDTECSVLFRAHRALTILGVTQDMSDSDVGAFLSFYAADHDAHRFVWDDFDHDSYQSVGRQGLAVARNYFCTDGPFEPEVFPGGPKPRQPVAMCPLLLQRFDAYLTAPDPALEPDFKDVANMALWAVGVRPSMSVAKVAKFLRDNKRQHLARDFTQLERGKWTSNHAMQTALKHVRICLNAET